MQTEPNEPMSPFLTVQEVADALAISDKTVRRMMKRGELKRHKVGRQVRISEYDFRAYVALSRGL